MRRLLMLLIVIGLLAAAFIYFRKPGTPVPQMPALDEVKEKIGQVGDKLRETKTAGSVKTALELDRDLQPYSFDVTADQNDGVVLKGAVPTDELRRRAGQIAAAVPGVARVDNQVGLGGTAAASSASDRTVGENFDDKALEAKVHLAFSLNKDLKGTDISESSFKRTVTLSGQVDTAAQRTLAVEIAQRVSGVASVTDSVGVRGAAAVASPAATDALSAARTAETAVRANASLAPYSLTVAAEEGRLVLRGQVKTAAEKDLAALVAR
ncbi:MAG: BON domain-containing protein, partial [Vicinamibacteria bacterium]